MCIPFTTPYFSGFWFADLLSNGAAFWGVISSLFKNETPAVGVGEIMFTQQCRTNEFEDGLRKRCTNELAP